MAREQAGKSMPTEDGSPDVERERILTAARDELVRWGIDRFSIQALAHRSGIDFAAIAHHWGDHPEQLILEVLRRWPGDQVAAPDTGDLRTDLRRLAQDMATYVSSVPGRALSSAFLIANADLPSVAIRSTAWRAHADTIRIVLDRAVAHGHLREGIDAIIAFELLFAPINMRALFTGDPIDDEYCATIAEMVWRAVTVG